ncbi:XdhC/CoxI family protein [uncultured Cohaesibacter sp.]|uniref:XdhC family protein n=1 Tax=uncultured Cohaesibacter sp. TaxID=1002546 RepID=UPI0029305A42|nr:XdhC/CoxI family protein [uncultured Cohaesibacter sp.]
MKVFKELIRENEAGRPCALASIVTTNGSIPASDKAKMLVRADGTIVGTVGGGLAEGKIIEAAIKAMEDGKSELVSFNLHDNPLMDSGMVCGGSLDIFVEPFLPAVTLYMFGGGHVGLVTAELAHRVGYKVVVIDDRAEFANAERFPFAVKTLAGPWQEMMKELEPNARSIIFIATRGHICDKDVLAWAVKTPVSYIGMIGSKRKIRTINSKLLEAGISAEQLSRVRAPVGLDIGADNPEEIAVSVVAQMIAHVRGAEGLVVQSRTIGDLYLTANSGTEDGEELAHASA